MFLKKSLLFTTALALLMFAGQASAQGVSFTHVPGEGGTAGMASGTDAIVVELEVTGVPVLPPVQSYIVNFDLSNAPVTLTSATNGAGDVLVPLGSTASQIILLASDITHPAVLVHSYVHPNIRCNGSGIFHWY